MNFKHLAIALATGLLATTAYTQSTGKPLNLKLPANLPAASSTAPAPSSSSAVSTSAHVAGSNAAGNSYRSTGNNQPATASTAPGVYYGDTSGRIENETADDTSQCDDSKYNQPQVHGSVSTGVVSSNHGSGAWNGGMVNLSQAFGSCDHPTGGVSISIGGETGHFHH